MSTISEHNSVHDTETSHIQWFRQASPYISQHRGKTFVLMLGGDAIASKNLPNIIGDISLLSHLGVRIVIAFGCRPQLSAALQNAGFDGELIDGKRVTTSDTLHQLEYAMAHNRLAIESLFSTGSSPTKVCSGNFVTARPAGVINGVDLQSTGVVRKIKSQAIEQLLNSGFVVLLGSVGFSVTGDRFNLTAEDIACETAITLKADKLIFFSHNNGVYHNGDLLREISCDKAKAISGVPFISQSISACEQGVSRCHIINFEENGALLQELFTQDGHGTLISDLRFEQLRKATINDVAGILALVKPLEEKGILITRSREILEQQHDHFTVIEREGTIIACAALHTFANSNMGELACVATHANYQKGDRGLRLLKAIELEAKEKNLQSLFVLTTQTEHWFVEKGFNEITVKELPEEKQKYLSLGRGSKAFCKNLV